MWCKMFVERDRTTTICLILAALAIFTFLRTYVSERDGLPKNYEHPTNVQNQKRVLMTKEPKIWSTNTSSDYKVPNIVHYIWYNTKSIDFRFDKALSVLSVVKYMKPEAIYFHTNTPPKGKYFEMLKKLPEFKVVHRDPSNSAFDKPYWETDYSNYDRVKVLIEEGGIYLDLDIMVTRSFDEIRKYPCTVGLEGNLRINGGVIVCVKDHAFLYLWLNGYYDDHRREWSYNSGTFPTRVIERYPNLVHIENVTFHEPGYAFLEKLWGNVLYPWREKYCIHTWIRMALQKNFLHSYPTLESIKTMNTTYGQMARDVYYGSSDLMKK